jgi:hypothetical protein
MEWSLPECGRQYIRLILNVNFLARGCVDVSDDEPAQLVKRICVIRYDKVPLPLEVFRNRPVLFFYRPVPPTLSSVQKERWWTRSADRR